MKRIIACLLTGVLAVGMMAGCSKKLTPEEQAASEAAVLAQQLQEEETQTGLKRLISNSSRTNSLQLLRQRIQSVKNTQQDEAVWLALSSTAKASSLSTALSTS